MQMKRILHIHEYKLGEYTKFGQKRNLDGHIIGYEKEEERSSNIQ